MAFPSSHRGKYSRQNKSRFVARGKAFAAPRRTDAKPAAGTSWNDVAQWYTDHLAGASTYQKTVIFPGALRLLEPQSGKTYLDIACGEGSFLRLVKSKAKDLRLYGIDAAPELIEAAKQQIGRDVSFELKVADASAFVSLFPAQSIDGATCLMAIQNIEDIDGVFKSASRVLKSGATLTIVMNHPCFRAPQQSGWGWDETRKIQYRRMDRYANSYAQPIQAHPGSAPSVKTLSYHRPLSVYINALASAGFVIDQLEEWTSNKESDSGPRAKAENVARTEFPLFLAIRARRN